MNQEYYFHTAKWIGANDRTSKSFSVIRGDFFVKKATSVHLHILGLGFFKCYINGHCINPDTFLPFASDYEAGCDPAHEVLSGHRIYVPSFDISKFVKEGTNVIAVHYGGGWYTHYLRTFGLPKMIYNICVVSESGTYNFGSDSNCRCRKSFVSQYDFISTEMHDYIGWEDCYGYDYDDSMWEQAVETEALNTEYCTTNCPSDGLIEQIQPQPLRRSEHGIIYDCGKNIVGYPVMSINAFCGESVKILFSEELQPDGNLNPNTTHAQFSVTGDGNKRNVQPEFTWFGFRYFEVIGNAIPCCVKVVHSQVPVRSHFECDNETLNWIYNTFIHTMRSNMHCGIPSDCPHLERRGYTGDGQLTCNAVLTTMDAKAFYEKWLQDIADSQDTVSGRIQNTAPFILSGGGPGGWGCAIIEIPYQLYRHYGNTDVLRQYYGNMCKYLAYLESITQFGLVVGGIEGIATLGDWCCPSILYPDKHITYCDQQSIIPPPYVNTYFAVKSLHQMEKIANILDKPDDAVCFAQKAETYKQAMKAAYFNTLDHSFIMNIHGANAFAVDIGIGSDKTYQNILDYYSKLGYYDTGIFATDILTRVLFENGNSELAVDLLTAYGSSGFENWRKKGATTFFEYWDTEKSRSHNHPMFGAVVSYFFEFLLGIQQKESCTGFANLIIRPEAVSRFHTLNGFRETANGIVYVGYTRENYCIDFQISIPQNTNAILSYEGREYALHTGENKITVKFGEQS